MMRLVVTLFLLILAACGAQPAPALLGGARHETTVEGRDYVLYRKGDRVEVIRTGGAAPQDGARLRATMIGLIPWLTGCDPIASSVTGDMGEIRARVRCPKGRR